MFTREEYQTRFRKGLALADQSGVDALLVLNFSHLHWLTGYDGPTSYLPQAIVLRPGDSEPLLIVREQDANGARHTTYLRDQNILSYPEKYIGSDILHPMDFIAETLCDLGLVNGRIGVEMDTPIYTYPTGVRFQEKLPSVRLVDISGQVNILRMRKSPQEIQYMREATQIADRAMLDGINAIEVGARQCDVAAVLRAAQSRGTPDFCGGWMGDFNTLPVGKRTNCPHIPWTDDPLKEGDALNIELGGARSRYVSAVSRTITLGKPPQNLSTLHAATVDGMNAVYEVAKPGVTCSHLAAVFDASIGKHGVSKTSRIGYTIGVDWMENSANLQRGDDTVLEPNMTFHLMLGMWRQRDGYVMSEVFRVTEAGCETWSKLPKEFIHR